MTFPHLDDEALSAAFDGEATDAEEAHLADCPRCRAELESLAAVAQAVGGPVTPPPRAIVDAAIARALGDWAVAGPAADEAAPGATPATTRLAQPAPPQPGPRPVIRPAPRRARLPSWALSAAGVAAAAAVVVGLVAVAGRFGASHTTASTSALSTLAPPVASGGSSITSTTISPFASPPADLGSQTDPTVVARLVTGAVQANDLPETALGPAPASSAPARAAAGSALTPCIDAAQRAVGATPGSGGIDVVYTATLRWRGQPAVVVVLSRAGRLSGVILRTPDCSSLVVLPL